MAITGLNELSILAKFIAAQLNTNEDWIALKESLFPKVIEFFEQAIPSGIKLDGTVGDFGAMFVDTMGGNDERGAFGIRLFSSSVYEIKAVTQGYDFSIIEKAANIIDTVFDWQNQIDPDAGRPRCQETFVDPDNPESSITIMCLLRNRAIKYSTFAQAGGFDYLHQGGEYYIEVCRN